MPFPSFTLKHLRASINQPSPVPITQSTTSSALTAVRAFVGRLFSIPLYILACIPSYHSLSCKCYRRLEKRPQARHSRSLCQPFVAALFSKMSEGHFKVVRVEVRVLFADISLTKMQHEVIESNDKTSKLMHLLQVVLISVIFSTPFAPKNYFDFISERMSIFVCCAELHVANVKNGLKMSQFFFKLKTKWCCGKSL